MVTKRIGHTGGDPRCMFCMRDWTVSLNGVYRLCEPCSKAFTEGYRFGRVAGYMDPVDASSLCPSRSGR